jgi:hypothetical protein
MQIQLSTNFFRVNREFRLCYQTKKGTTKKQTLQPIAEGMQAAINASKNKGKARPAKESFNEL